MFPSFGRPFAIFETLVWCVGSASQSNFIHRHLPILSLNSEEWSGKCDSEMRRQLRVWWPKQLPPSKLQSPPPPHSSYILFGWFVSPSSASLDIVVALAMDEASLPQLNSSIEEILCKTNRNMPIHLQKQSFLSVVGQYVTDIHSTLPKVTEGVEKWHSSSSVTPTDGNMWIKLVNGSYGQYSKFWVPKVESIHFKGELMSHCDVHVILYRIPRYGSHHFSLSYSDFSKQAKVPLKKPQWLVKLQLQNSVVDLDTVIVALNCSAAAERYLKIDIGTKKHIWLSIASRFYVFMWHLLAIVTATLSSLFYIIIQCFYCCSSVDLVPWIWSSSWIFDTTWANIKVWSSRISCWPIFLLESGSRFNSCVEYAEKAALRKHSMWSNLAVDILLGNFLGWALMLHAESVSSCVLSLGNDASNLSRTGCVWLMGVPAGFKLNTEAAAVLGTISLHVIQIWSTLLVLVSFFFNFIIKGLALSGVVFGASIFAALLVDLTVIASLHLTTLHWLTSLVYSLQIQALVALWRLFRGQKLNPLRVRLDSYDYTVEQHIVGSLLFTPLLLLLPTTSVFYIFFTIMSSSISIICIMTEVLISLIHGTPYVKIFLWLVNRRRFPSGIWFEIASTVESANDLVSFLHSNFPNVGDITRPHYGEVFSQRFRSLVAASAYGALTGRRVPQRFGTRVPASTPWMAIPVKDYWLLCRESVLSCSGNGDSI